jgi:hypothetical protein
MEVYHYINLLQQVDALTERYNKITELTGENFNVFRILKLEASEVRMHSSLIAELLNPKGSHGQKDIFLKLFVNVVCFKGVQINTADCKVEVEKHAGFINEEGTEGGRIDIVITDTKLGHHVIIENKIYAGDQKNQLVRYNKYSPNSDLLYLTLEGNEPTQQSFGHLKKEIDFNCISYKSTILNWLEQCRKEVAIYPIVRESITQYVNLIKYLTNQTLNNTMQEELNIIIKNNLKASFAIAEGIDEALNILLKQEFIPTLEVACKEIGINCSNGIDFNKNYSGIWLWKDEWQYVNIGFQFWSKDKDMIYGFTTKEQEDNQPLKLPEILKSSLASLGDSSLRQNGWWPLYRKLESPYNNWEKYEAWKAIADGTMKDMMIEKIKELLESTQSFAL